jgi:hypothetical protein
MVSPPGWRRLGYRHRPLEIGLELRSCENSGSQVTPRECDKANQCAIGAACPLVQPIPLVNSGSRTPGLLLVRAECCHTDVLIDPNVSDEPMEAPPLPD